MNGRGKVVGWSMLDHNEGLLDYYISLFCQMRVDEIDMLYADMLCRLIRVCIFSFCKNVSNCSDRSLQALYNRMGSLLTSLDGAVDVWHYVVDKEDGKGGHK